MTDEAETAAAGAAGGPVAGAAAYTAGEAAGAAADAGAEAAGAAAETAAAAAEAAEAAAAVVAAEAHPQGRWRCCVTSSALLPHCRHCCRCVTPDVTESVASCPSAGQSALQGLYNQPTLQGRDAGLGDRGPRQDI